jgi:hypothetical protein
LRSRKKMIHHKIKAIKFFRQLAIAKRKMKLNIEEEIRKKLQTKKQKTNCGIHYCHK